MNRPRRVCVIGAGSSGIVATKLLRAAGIDVVCFEKGSGVGGNWRYQNDNGMSAAYASLHINTSKGRMAYSDFPMPAEYPEYAHHTEVLRYFESYVDHFAFRDAIRFSTSVESVRPASAADDPRWEVRVRDSAGDRAEVFDAVVVANGHHWKPRLPRFAGAFSGATLHAHEYKSPDLFAGKRVLIVGIGNSAVDIACECSHVARTTVISTRRSAYVFPKYFFGRPLDTFTSPAVSKLPLAVQSAIMHALLRIARGDQAKYGVPRPPHALTAAHPTISEDLLGRVQSGAVRIRPNIAALEGEQVRFDDGSAEPFDVIVYATGYDIAFPFLPRDVIHFDDNDIRLYRRVVPLDQPGLYFVGLVQPLGAVMPLAEAQSKWVTGLIAGTHRLPPRAAMEREIETYVTSLRKRYVGSPRHTIQVDFFPYLEELAGELKSAHV